MLHFVMGTGSRRDKFFVWDTGHGPGMVEKALPLSIRGDGNKENFLLAGMRSHPLTGNSMLPFLIRLASCVARIPA
jgi:hypothetical protein